MAMTTKGIQYFPLDVNFFEDDKIAVIINDYGFEAVGVTLKLFSQIYKNGFYMNWNAGMIRFAKFLLPHSVRATIQKN